MQLVDLAKFYVTSTNKKSTTDGEQQQRLQQKASGSKAAKHPLKAQMREVYMCAYIGTLACACAQ